jgi:hypothetical protein
MQAETNDMQLQVDRWLLAALLLSAICCSAAEDVEAATYWWNRVDTAICTANACPAGQYATSTNPVVCSPCLPGTFKATDGATCCQKCSHPLQTFNAADKTYAFSGATGCGECTLQCGISMNMLDFLLEDDPFMNARSNMLFSVACCSTECVHTPVSWVSSVTAAPA